MRWLIPVLCLPLAAACGRQWTQPVAAGLLATQLALGIHQAVKNKGKRRTLDAPPPCPIPPPPPKQRCLGAPRNHKENGTCTYFCTDHCSYHLAEP